MSSIRPAPRDTLSSTPTASHYSINVLLKDFIGGIVVFLVALPLCLGIAVASGAPQELPLVSGLIAGIIGGLVVGAISGSHTSVSGPAAGMTAVVIAQIAKMGSFDVFLLAVLIAGVLQILAGLFRGGAISAFIPLSVIKGLLASIGIILILKQIPHLLGHDLDPEGEFSFHQPDNENTFSEIGRLFAGEVHNGAIVVGLISIGLLVLWERWPLLQKSVIPGPLVVVLLGVSLNAVFLTMAPQLAIQRTHLVELPVVESMTDLLGFLTFPDFSAWNQSAVWMGAITIAAVASIETLLNLEAVDRLDRFRRDSPPNRELVAQGCGNLLAGLVGGLPITSVVVRGSVNTASGSQTKAATIIHGAMLLLAIVVLPMQMNRIPLASLAAILIVTGLKLASPGIFYRMWSAGRYQFLPFITTVVAIVFTDLLIGVGIGLGVSLLFILNSNLRHPIRRIVETHVGGDVLHVDLPAQVSFLNRAALDRIFEALAPGSHILLDASESDYIDPDILYLIRDLKDNRGPARGIQVSLRGFRKKYELQDEIQFADYSTRELTEQLTPERVLKLLQAGNRRFKSGTRISRDFGRQIDATAAGQNPMAAVVGCIDSRVPIELVFDLGIGDAFSIRVAGNVLGITPLASVEYAVIVAGVKLVLVLGHTRCGAVTSSVRLLCSGQDPIKATGCPHLPSIMHVIAASLPEAERRTAAPDSKEEEDMVNLVTRRNVMNTVNAILARSPSIREAHEAGRIRVVGGLYD
ncbi:MAG: bifunctional SulP family inorganic anion transporter/carbonic anhydrase, partial [Planctomycetaceae bacterium]|nr:bifunctional SulP family inorganic anion transporter/carbonic anhydrase [Planctomycetaceae bacterium]